MMNIKKQDNKLDLLKAKTFDLDKVYESFICNDYQYDVLSKWTKTYTNYVDNDDKYYKLEMILDENEISIFIYKIGDRLLNLVDEIRISYDEVNKHQFLENLSMGIGVEIDLKLMKYRKQIRKLESDLKEKNE